MPNESQLEIINSQIQKELSNKQAVSDLLNTVFKGLTEPLMRRAMLEAMMRGLTFKDFLEKNVYAIPFTNRKTGEQTYSLVNSIDYVRKLAMRSGLSGKSEPKFIEKDGVIESCSVTVKRANAGVIGDYTATVYFKEYNTGYQQWASKPHTMIAKVAEMHALRSAFPEEMSQMYAEEELQKESIETVQEINLGEWQNKLEACKNLDELKTVFASMPIQAKEKFKGLKDELKAKLAK